MLPFVGAGVGVEIGLTVGHYSAAALESHDKGVAAPGSGDVLPIDGMEEAQESMVWLALRKLRKVIDNVRRYAIVDTYH